jgi:hypothetical protein
MKKNYQLYKQQNKCQNKIINLKIIIFLFYIILN